MLKTRAGGLNHPQVVNSQPDLKKLECSAAVMIIILAGHASCISPPVMSVSKYTRLGVGGLLLAKGGGTGRSRVGEKKDKRGHAVPMHLKTCEIISLRALRCLLGAVSCLFHAHFTPSVSAPH